MSVVGGLKTRLPEAEIHWVIRADMAPLLKIDPRIDKIWEFDRKEGFKGLLRLGTLLQKEKYHLIYDAHSNLRSTVLKFLLCPLTLCNLFHKNKLVTRHKNRIKRLLLFKLGINLLPKPFKAQESFRFPLRKKWNIEAFDEPFAQWTFPKEVESKVAHEILNKIPKEKKWVILVPSAAWELKRWPENHWKKLVELRKDLYFVVLGGPNDTFCENIQSVAPERVLNLAGKTSLIESFCAVQHAPFVISGDTGFLHAADLFQKPGIALIGPTAFGYPSGRQMMVLEIDLPCRPCTKDGNTHCKLKEIKKCLVDIRPETVAENIIF